MLARIIGWLLLLVVVLITFWLLYGLKENLPNSYTRNESKIPDYTMKNFVVINMDEQGLLKERLTAKKMLHYQDNSLHLYEPKLAFYKQGQLGWQLEAEQGEISSNGNDILLIGAARLWKDNTVTTSSIQILSQDVQIQKDKGYAETNAPTTVLRANDETHSMGMRAFMQTEQIELLSQINTTYRIK